MSNRWIKSGCLYCLPDKNRHPKLQSHTANPLPVLLEDDIYRIFFSSRDANNRSSVGAVDIDIVTQTIVREHDEPLFEHGVQDSFYSDGVSIGNCYTTANATYMLFMGWQRPKDAHWRGDIGRLVVNADMSLELASDIPFMGIGDHDPLSLSYPWVMEDGNRGFHMWYGSTKTWDAGNGEMLHVINYASSNDGIIWDRQGLAVPYELGKAQAFSRPTVVRNSEFDYEMWFSYRSGGGQTYRIGYATSRDGRNWELALENAGIGVSASGWDSEMIEYPFVLDHKGQRYMLYNGNSYGKTGFGLAIMGQA